MIDPMRRWRELGEKPEFAGLPSWASTPYTEEPEELEGADLVVIGAPSDELASDLPGARTGPRAIRAASLGPGARIGSVADPFERLRVIDYGDAAVRPGDAEASHAAIASLVGDVVAAGARPLVLGGDHSISAAVLRALAAEPGRLGLIQLDAHTDTAATLFGVRSSHGTMMRALVEDGTIDPGRYAQLGIRGHWPGPEVLAWQAEHGVTTVTMDEIEAGGLQAGLRRALAAAGDGPVYLSVDIDVVDPGMAPSTGTPEPGGLLPRELLRAVREIARGVELAGADVVEVIAGPGPGLCPTALLADRVMREVVAGIADRRPVEASLAIAGRQE